MSDLLKLALKAQIPIVRITTDDPDHVQDLLKNLGDGRTVEELGRFSSKPSQWKDKHIYYGLGDQVPQEVDYSELLSKDITLVVVNPDEGQWAHARDCGALTPPVDYIMEALEGFLRKTDIEKFARYFVGMSMKDVAETIMLTQARDGGKLSSTGINETKSYLGAGMPGLEAVDTTQAFYVPPAWAEEWLESEAPLLQIDKYRELWPKGFMLYGPTGTGKCLDPDERLLRHDGSTVRCGDVVVGDRLMGPDGTARTVLSTAPGFGPMFEVRPNKGRVWRCNGDHILSLRKTGTGEVRHVTVNEWLTWPKSRKHLWKQWRTAVSFPRSHQPAIDPYLIGLMLGDGSSTRGLSVHTVDPEIAEYLALQATEHGLCLSKYHYPPRIPSYAFTSPTGRKDNGHVLHDVFDRYGLRSSCGDKSVPFVLKTGSAETRKRLLAGLLDSDGSYDSCGVFDFISKSRALAEDAAFMARSLGLAANGGECRKTCQGSFEGIYHRVCISGELEQLPLLVKRKKPRPRKMNKDVTNVGFDIVPLGDGEWFGFTLDGDRQFLLDDFTVTHNTELARYIAKSMTWPLYRLDLGSLYSRWQGQSEQNLRRILSFVSGQGECVFLLDEAEKLFGNEAVGQASLTTLLSMLLWWLQGQSNRTVTVMTANKLDVIPPELYRPGRLDAVHEMLGLTGAEEWRAFVKDVAERLGKSFDLAPDAIKPTIAWEGPVSQATVVAQLRAAVKRLLLKEELG